MSKKDYDFSGWATRNDIRCSDGRVIKKDAFIENDGQTVSIVYNHSHDDLGDVIGHGLLENRDEGVYIYGKLNDTPKGRLAKELIQHGDVSALSIYANNLKQKGSEVIHGMIREVSLVLAGANPGAYIDTVIAHSAYHDEEAIIHTGYITTEDEEDTLEHSDKTEEKEMAAEDNKKVEEPIQDAEKKDSEDKGKTIKDVFDTLTEEQKKVVYAIIGASLTEKDTNKTSEEDEDKDDSNDNKEGDKEMKHNVFENEENEQSTLSHDAMNAIIGDAKRFGSMKESYLAHADEYGITSIDWLFPDYKTTTDTPGFVKREPSDWVNVVMNGVHHTPFSRIKSVFADIREDEARAKGYIKGKLKKEEVFSLLRRTTDPTTIYKKQKLDRDDIIDITDFDVVSWIKGEMRVMLDEEIARAILFGDGRTALSEDKINESNIRPIVSDAALYTISKTVSASSATLAKDLIVAAVEGKDDYQGSGNTIMFMAQPQITKMLLLEDTIGHRLYKNKEELALACDVNRIVAVPKDVLPTGVYAVIADLNDYNIGADKGGSINMFDDFDIDYNQQKYLMETRCSGALTKPYSAIVIKAAE